MPKGKEKPRPAHTQHVGHHHKAACAPSSCHGANTKPWGCRGTLGGTLEAPTRPSAQPGPQAAPLPGKALTWPRRCWSARNAELPPPSLLSQRHRNSAPRPGRPPAPMGAEPAAPCAASSEVPGLAQTGAGSQSQNSFPKASAPGGSLRVPSRPCHGDAPPGSTVRSSLGGLSPSKKPPEGTGLPSAQPQNPGGSGQALTQGRGSWRDLGWFGGGGTERRGLPSQTASEGGPSEPPGSPLQQTPAWGPPAPSPSPTLAGECTADSGG